MNIVLWIAVGFAVLAVLIVLGASLYYTSSRPKADDWGGLILAVYGGGLIGVVAVVLGAVGLIAKIF